MWNAQGLFKIFKPNDIPSLELRHSSVCKSGKKQLQGCLFDSQTELTAVLSLGMTYNVCIPTCSLVDESASWQLQSCRLMILFLKWAIEIASLVKTLYAFFPKTRPKRIPAVVAQSD